MMRGSGQEGRRKHLCQVEVKVDHRHSNEGLRSPRNEPPSSQTITIRDYFRPSSSNMMLVWGAQRSKVKPQLDWAKGTTKTSYRVLGVQLKARWSLNSSYLYISMRI
jgi:hypothetical protein